ncbi:MAG: pilus assembly protein PilM [Actinobacteria bacterium]|nr:pilus assembly protein PilM [Actinomycetota bacterium]
MADNFCIHLGENSLKIAKSVINRGQIDIVGLGRQNNIAPFYELDNDKMIEEVSSVIKKIVLNLKLENKPVNVVVPDAFTYSQIVEMPRLKEKELLSAIRYQADQFIPMPIEETSLDLEILLEDKNRNKLLVLIIASPQNLVEKIERTIESAGINPESIENELSATGRLLTNYYKKNTADSTGTILLNFGYSASSLYYFSHEKNNLLDCHNFKIGLSIFLREAQADVNIDLPRAKDMLKNIGLTKAANVDLDQILTPTASALSDEIQKFATSVNQKFGNAKISEILIFNQSGEINQLDKKIESLTTVKTATIDLQPYIRKSSMIDSLIKELPSFVPVIGGSL